MVFLFIKETSFCEVSLINFFNSCIEVSTHHYQRFQCLEI